jgi:copper resistance protein D
MSDPYFAILTLARWAEFLSLFVLFGVLLFPFYVTGAAPAPSRERLASAMRRAIAFAGAVQPLSILAWLATSMANMGDGWTSLGDADFVKAFFLEAGFGRLWLARLLLTALLLGVLVGARRRLPARDLATTFALVLAGALLVTQAGVGHPAGQRPDERLLVFGGYALHLLGGAAWIGGLWPLRAVMAEAKHDDRGQDYAQFALRRFATMASVAVALVLLGAAINIRPQIAALNVLDLSSWWWAAGSKAVLFGALIAIAYRNRFVLTPLLATRPKEAATNLLRNIIIDQGLAAVVLAIAAFMGVASPTG